MTEHRSALRWALLLITVLAAVLGTMPTTAMAAETSTPTTIVADGETRAAAEETIIDTSEWPIYNLSDDKCMEIRGTGYDLPALKETCNLEYTRHYWKLVPSGVTGYYQLRNRYSQRCLLVRGTANETPAVQAACGANTDQHWAIQQEASTKTFMLKNRNSGKCLTMRPTQTNARQATCGTQYLDQKWQRGMPLVAEFTPYLHKPVYLIHGYSADGAALNVNQGYFGSMNTSLKDCSAASNRGVLCLQASTPAPGRSATTATTPGATSSAPAIGRSRSKTLDGNWLGRSTTISRSSTSRSTRWRTPWAVWCSRRR